MSKCGSCSCEKPFLPGKNPTVVSSRFFLVNEDAAALYEALHSSTTDTATIIDILANRSLAQRLDIINQYRSQYDADLVEDLKSKLSGDFKSVIVAMMTPLDQYYASELNYAMAGLGTDESDLTEILCTLSNAEILAIRRSYQQQYSVNLEDDLTDETSGEYRDLLLSLCRAERDEKQNPDQEAALADANSLYNATTDTRWSLYHDVFCHRSYAQMLLIFDAYQNVAGKSIETAIEDFFSGDIKNGLLAVAGEVRNPAAFFAQQLHTSMAGLGTNDRDLIRLVVTRSEIDMGDIKKEYEAQYSVTLAADIIDDTSGDYQKCLLVLIGEEAKKC